MDPKALCGRAPGFTNRERHRFRLEVLISLRTYVITVGEVRQVHPLSAKYVEHPAEVHAVSSSSGDSDASGWEFNHQLQKGGTTMF